MHKRRYRRIKPTPNCKSQGYQLSLIAFMVAIGLTVLLFYISYSIDRVTSYLAKPLLFLYWFDLICLALSLFLWSKREEVSTISIPTMSKQANRLSQKLKRLFNDKQITDVLKLSNSTRYGDEMPEITVWVHDNLNEGYIAIENIANWERADREKFEQRVSGILAGNT